MCGIAGVIGKSKKPSISHQLATKLFAYSESRGIDAAGYWGTSEDSILYHKEPVRSSEFVKTEMWKRVSRHDPDLLLMHARGASKGVGEPRVNINNHPFVSHDRQIGLIHNGRISDVEYQALRQKYEVLSQCDSEILLRIFEAGEGEELFPRMSGVRDIFRFINNGHMAVAIGECRENERFLWLFRNEHRPLWIVDMRDSLGQIFFVSEPGIWSCAVQTCPAVRALCRSQKLIRLPTEEVWCFRMANGAVPEGVQRFRVCKSDIRDLDFDGDKKPIVRQSRRFRLITRLDDKDQILPKARKVEASDEPDRTFEIDAKFREIRGLILGIESAITTRENSDREMTEWLSRLEDCRLELSSLLVSLD